MPENLPHFELVTSEDIVAALTHQTAELMPFWRSLSGAQSPSPAGKWNVKQVLNHVTDAERV